MENLMNLTEEQLDFICKQYNLIPKKMYEKKSDGIV